MANRQPQQVYQFKITIKDSKPPIWRRLLVRDNYTLTDLHNAIQAAFDWGHCHLWLFGDYSSELNKKRKITQVFKEIGSKVAYIYDFGDNWDHVVELEAIKPADLAEKYPKCVAGRQAAPPCCSGGIHGFYEMLEIIKDPAHPDYEERWDWLRTNGVDDCFQPGYKFKPESVDFEADASMIDFFKNMFGEEYQY